MSVLRRLLLGAVLLGAGVGGIAMAVLIGRPTGAAAAATPATLVGDSRIEPTASAVSSGSALAWQYKASTNGKSASESLYVDGSTDAARHLVVGLYTDVAGTPGVLLGSGTSNVKPNAWNTVTIHGVSVTAGRQYWLAILGTDGQLGYRQVYGGCRNAQSSQQNLNKPPKTWTGSSTGLYPNCASLYIAGATGSTTTSSTSTSRTSTTGTSTTGTSTTHTTTSTTSTTSTTHTTTSTTSTTTTTTTGGGKLQSAGWWPAWDATPPMSSIPWGALTQIIMFSDTTMTSSPWLNTSNHGLTADNQQQLVSLAHQHGDTAILSIGGAEDQNWSTACNSTNRAAFIDAAISQMRQYSYDGVELDIEEGPWVGTSDFNACAKAFHDMLKATSTTVGKPPLLSLDADPTWEAQWIPPVAPYLDQINLMDYDATCANGCAAVANSIAQFTQLGIPASKLLDGIGLDPGMPGNNNPSDCGAKGQYLSSHGVAGVAEWIIQDDYPGYSCLGGLAPYVG